MSGSAAYAPGGALAAATGWLVALVTGPLGTSLAMLGVAALGFALLQGRLAITRAAAVVTGCFILFGAHAIAAGLMDLAGGDQAAVAPSSSVPTPQLSPAPPPPPYDPYAGASVPG